MDQTLRTDGQRQTNTDCEQPNQIADVPHEQPGRSLTALNASNRGSPNPQNCPAFAAIPVIQPTDHIWPHDRSKADARRHPVILEADVLK